MMSQKHYQNEGMKFVHDVSKALPG